MPFDLSKLFVIGISSSALFDLSKEDGIFREQGLKAYADHQIAHEDDLISPGAGFDLVKAILKLNETKIARKAEVIIMSKNNADTSLRIANSIQKHGLDISRAAFTSGSPLANYMDAFDVDLFLSTDIEDVRAATDAGFPAGRIYAKPEHSIHPVDELRIAFDGDAVLFSNEAQQICDEQGLDGFMEHEITNAKRALPDGPLAKVLRALAVLQKEEKREKKTLIRTALVTARNFPAHERVIRTLRKWGVRVDEVFFLGGATKTKVLEAFGAHIFFDDQESHCKSAANTVPTAQVYIPRPNQKPPQGELPLQMPGTTSELSEAV